ncbi:hypothetical protein OG936_24845 [Streptomyces sp. NBC_00846]|uniref:hypothetical protein n=1 Tax=Streptomyces sp. NBC_00846 TaxID=2975849 RepID=UPI003863FF35|nr:hypothetical protein OG936_24845 [Streptomyces sp. NBC_00846]
MTSGPHIPAPPLNMAAAGAAAAMAGAAVLSVVLLRGSGPVPARPAGGEARTEERSRSG